MTLRKDNKKLQPWNLLKSEDSGTKELSDKRVSGVVATSGVGWWGPEQTSQMATGCSNHRFLPPLVLIGLLLLLF
jgi:hypothetical protein